MPLKPSFRYIVIAGALETRTSRRITRAPRSFASVSNFNRHFHAVIHMTPREYRNQMLFARQKEGTDIRHTILEFSGWMEPESDPL